MDQVVAFLIVSVSALGAGLTLFFARRIQMQERPALRQIPAYTALANQVGRAVESGRQVHLTLGRGSISGPATITSLAGLGALDSLARDGCGSNVPPIVTAGDGTLLPAGQDSVRHAYTEAGRLRDYLPGKVQFVAVDTMPFVYAAGVGDIVQQGNVGGNVMVGRFGLELALVTETARRSNAEQVIGTDDPVGLALAFAATENVLVGEELLAARAYLEGEPTHLASLQVQDIMRFVVAGVILLAALLHLIVG
jgi:hypothetical protein